MKTYNVTDVKKLLMNVRNAQIEVNSLREEIERLDTKAKDCTTHLKNVQVQTSMGEGQIDENIPEKMDLETIINQRINSISHDQKRAELLIQKLDYSSHRNVLRFYYLNAHTWEETAELMSYDNIYIFTLGKKAMRELQKIADIRSE